MACNRITLGATANDILLGTTVNDIVTCAAQELAADISGSATVSASIQVDRQISASIEGNATVEGGIQTDVQISTSIEANATVEADLEVASGAVEISSDIEGNATVSGNLQKDVQTSSSIEGNATAEATLELVEAAAEEIVSGGGWLPPKNEVDRGKEEREARDAYKREIAKELETAFNRINGIEEISEELAEIVEPFAENPKENKKTFDLQPQLQHIDFEALSAQADAAERLFELMDRMNRQRDEDDALAILLLVS